MGTISPKHPLKPCYATSVKARRINHMMFPGLLCKQGVTGSIPVTSTNLLKLNHSGRYHFAALAIFEIGEQ